MTLRRVLLVDDEPDIRTVGELSLGAVGGWEVALAESGFEALTVAADFEPDVILLDVMMPRMDGPTTLAKLRESPHLSHIPVIFLTAKVQKIEIASYLEMGAVGVIAKPFDPMTLADQVRAIIATPSPSIGDPGRQPL